MELLKKCLELTPIQGGKYGPYYKREDLFSPFEDSPINGTKLRQLIYLFYKYTKEKNRVVSAASVKSPQLPMVARVSKEFDLPCELFIGSSNFETAVKNNPMVALAVKYGANLNRSRCAFNSALQHAGKAFAKEDDYFLEYGISTTKKEQWKDFYSFGGKQVENIPDSVTTITMTAGSCNSVTSLLVGLQNQGRLSNFKYELVGVGPSKMKLLKERFEYVTSIELPIDLITFHDCHQKKLFTYHDRIPFSLDGIVFHPTYEGKMMWYLRKFKPDLLRDETNLIWIVGSEPNVQ